MTEGVAVQENRLDSSTQEIIGWSTGYVDRHPITALRTVGGQCVLAVRAFQYFFIDLARARFPFREFVEQATFMARTAAVPTLFIAVPLSVTLAINSACWPGNSAPPRWPGRPTAWRSCGRVPHWSPPS